MCAAMFDEASVAVSGLMGKLIITAQILQKSIKCIL